MIGNSSMGEHEFETAQLRRECARIIAGLATSDISYFLRVLDNNQVSWKRWIESLDSIKDKRAKVHTQKLKQVIAKRLNNNKKK